MNSPKLTDLDYSFEPNRPDGRAACRVYLPNGFSVLGLSSLQDPKNANAQLLQEEALNAARQKAAPFVRASQTDHPDISSK
jgi:hypothetical protein